MAKNKTYETDELLLDIDSDKLDSASEKQLSETIAKLKEEYSNKRKNRIEKSKRFVIMYKDAREYLVELYGKVKNGEITPDNAIENFKEHANKY